MFLRRFSQAEKILHTSRPTILEVLGECRQQINWTVQYSCSASTILYNLLQSRLADHLKELLMLPRADTGCGFRWEEGQVARIEAAREPRVYGVGYDGEGCTLFHWRKGLGMGQYNFFVILGSKLSEKFLWRSRGIQLQPRCYGCCPFACPETVANCL